MANTTKIPAVKEAILNILQSTDLGDGVVVTAGEEPRSAEEYVWLWKGRSRREFQSMGGANGRPARNELITITMRVVAIKATLDGDEILTSEARAVEIMEALEDALYGDLKLQDSALFSQISGVEIEPAKFDTRWGCSIVLTVEAKARI